MTQRSTSIADAQVDGNDPARLEWFRGLGLGLFIHWSVDAALGVDISHSLVGADEAYADRYFSELPGTFTASRFAPEEWAALARLAGVRYVVFTTKHHNGFCMFHTATTDWQIAGTPFARDATREILDAFRAQGIAAGVYFSPDDFAWLRRNGIPIQRHTPEVIPANNPGLMDLDRAQVAELLTGYGDVDLIFFDGPAEGLREHAWAVRPGVIVTRGAMPTPEQHVPGLPVEGAWESNLTMGTQWNHKPTNERYKSGTELIERLVETRAKGGNLLLNVGPRADGTLPVEQDSLLRELALWMFVNGECIHGTRPWIVTNERELWFTTGDEGRTLYVVVTGEPWGWGSRRELVLASVRATASTTVSVLGQSGSVLEYRPDADVAPRWEQRDDGLHVSAVATQRLYNDRKWPNPTVLRLTDVEPAFLPPRVSTVRAAWDDGRLVVAAALDDLGGAESIRVTVEFQDVTGLDVTERPSEWERTASAELAERGERAFAVPDARPDRRYAVRARADLPLFSVHGHELAVEPRAEAS